LSQEATIYKLGQISTLIKKREMIYLKVKCTHQQIKDIIEKYYPMRIGVCTFDTDKETHYIAINENNDVTAKLIIDFSLANITVQAVGETYMEQLSPLYQKPPSSNSPSFIGDYNLFPFGINYRTNTELF